MSHLFFPPGLLPQAAHFETNQALLLVDFQNDFVKPDGKLFVSNTAGFLPKLPSLVAQFRSKGDVFWIRTEFERSRSLISPTTNSYNVVLKELLNLQTESHPDGEVLPGLTSEDQDHSIGQHDINPLSANLVQNPEAFLSTNGIPSLARCCLPGTRGAQFPEELLAVMDGGQDTRYIKSSYSAFEGTSLLQDLRMRLVTKLYICGSLSNISVYATVLDAVTHGLSVTIIEDCLGFRDDSCHIEAVRLMADDMCAEGTDYQELMDDLAGLLGDVVNEEDFTTRFQVSMSTPRSHGRIRTLRPSAMPASPSKQSNEHLGIGSSQPQVDGALSSRESLVRSDSSSRKSLRQGTPETSPPRKRTNVDLELEEPEHKTSHKPSQRRASHEAYSGSTPDSKPNRVRMRRPKKPGHSQQNTSRAMTPPISAPGRPSLESQSTGDIPAARARGASLDADTAIELPTAAQSSEQEVEDGAKPPNTTSRKKPLAPPDPLGPEDSIGEGDSRILYDLLPHDLASDIFPKLKAEVNWQKMYHRTSEVPRLVAVQGEMSTSADDSSIVVPIYRHPADESPELLPVTETVASIRHQAEKAVGHPLNHVLIQLYRSGEDNISEHSDKTLDIVHGSKIVNYSCGAMRMMTLRTKKSAVVGAAPPAETAGPRIETSPTMPVPDHTHPNDQTEQPETHIESATSAAAIPMRPTQRIPMPHNSLFVLGPATNTLWLHAIRADKRPPAEKTSAELACAGERISLTFRNIGTFIDTQHRTIWGQGATVKDVVPTLAVPQTDADSNPPTHSTGPEAARGNPIQTGAAAEREGEKMIRAFGQENHRSLDWRWDEWYGAGFDVVNFAETKVGHGSREGHDQLSPPD